MQENEIIFARTRYHYDSYTDFWKLVELSGYKTIYVDEIDISQPAVIITAPHNGEWVEQVGSQITKGKPRRSHLIHWNLERPSGSAGSLDHYMTRQWELISKRYFDEIWVSDRKLAEETSLRYVTLGSDEGLGSIEGKEKIYDFCHMSAPVPRRTGVYARFPIDKIAPNSWPPERDEILQKSKFALNVHQDIYPYQEPLRFALFAAYGLPIISEALVESYPYSNEYIITAQYPQLVAKMRQVLTEDYEIHKQMGLRTRDRMCKEFRFKNMVDKAVLESCGWR
jgi:hypothetical protein